MKKGKKKGIGFDFQGSRMILQKGYYRNGGRLALFIITEDGEPYTDLTVNIPGTSLDNGEIIVKTWSENEEIAQAALQSGLFVDTGKRVGAGFVEAQVWRFTDPAILAKITDC